MIPSFFIIFLLFISLYHKHHRLHSKCREKLNNQGKGYISDYDLYLATHPEMNETKAVKMAKVNAVESEIESVTILGVQFFLFFILEICFYLCFYFEKELFNTKSYLLQILL